MSVEELEREVIEGFVASSPLNRLQRIDGSPIFDAPLVGVADGLSASHNDLATLRVICWVLPIAETTRSSNRSEVTGPSERWHHTKAFGESFNDALRSHLVTWLSEQGYLALTPVLSAIYRTRSKALRLTSPWSERHALYAAGLGTFSLSDGFITPNGMAIRYGSVVTNMPLAVSPRRYITHRDNCLHYREGTC